MTALLAELDRTYDAARHRDCLRGLWAHERWFDAPRQRAAAAFVRDALAEAGLADACLVPYPCDGQTRFQDWTTRMAWDCAAARLMFANDGTVLADRAEAPTAVVQWSGPLASPGAPARAGVVDGDALATPRPDQVDGRFVLTAQPPAGMRHRLVACRPLAILSDYLGAGRGYGPHTTKWWNSWTDQPNGWHTVAADRTLPGFALSTSRGGELRGRLAVDPGLQLAAFCDSRVYAGECHNITALLPGSDPQREVWLYGHAYEPGAHDNASGVTVMIEALRLLRTLVDRGRLPRPRAGIRMIATEECLGMLAFGTARADLRRRAIAGLNIDGAGDPGTPEDPFFLHFGPLSQPTFAWPVASLIGAELRRQAGDRWILGHKMFVPTADDMIGDPHAGVPTLWLGKGKSSLGYHSDADTPDVCCPHALRYHTLLAAAWAYTMATLDATSAAPLLAPAAQWVDDFLLRGVADEALRLRRWAAGRVFRDLARWGVPAAQIEPVASRYAAADAPPLDDLPAAGPSLRRTVWGPCTFSSLPAADRQGLSSWSGILASGFYWCDGYRPLAALERLARAETLRPDVSILARGVTASLAAGTMR